MSWSAQTIASEPRLAAAYKRLSDKLKEIFQLEHADLDFGIYRILKLRKAELERFLDHELLPQVGQILSQQAGADADPVDEVLTLAREVFSDLLTFFSRYYDEGDFMSLPRYGKDKYAIPYDGAEVKLHWANADQYYVKSTEYFADYVAVLEDGVQGLAKPRLCFKLAHAESDRDNNKASEKRRFVLREQDAVQVDGDTLTAWFEWKAVSKDEAGGKTTQDALNAASAEQILAAVKPGSPWHAVLTRPRAGSDKTHLAYQLWRYTKKNTSDYFIHKDLGGFLRRELDFYIKNEVLFLDDIEGRTAEQIDGALRKIKALRQVAHKLIDWLAQLEDFQKRLFLKQRAAHQSSWLIPLKLLPPELLPLVASSAKQRDAWKRWFGVDLTDLPTEASTNIPGADIGFIERNPMLLVDTSLYPLGFTYRLLSELPMDALNGSSLLVHGENLQALRFLRRRYGGEVESIFIDPPYNTGNDGFVYKDGYPESSWLAMMRDRLQAGRELLSSIGSMSITIDRNEAARLRILGDSLFGPNNFVAEIAWQKLYTIKNSAKYLSEMWDSILLYAQSKSHWVPRKLARSEAQDEAYGNPDDDPNGPWISNALQARNYYSAGNYRIECPGGRVIDGPPTGTYWRTSESNFWALHRQGRVWWGTNGNAIPRIKKYLSEMSEGVVPVDYWLHQFAGTNAEAKTETRDMLGEEVEGLTPKPVKLLKRLVEMTSLNGVVVDYFAGSGTTGEAVLRQNAADGGQRTFILVESGSYFDRTLVPRMLRANYATDWSDGKPGEKLQSNSVLKIIRLESYDDTLENIALTRSQDAQNLLDADAALREQYMLRYMLDLESRGSLLNLTKFDKPWDYTIKVRKDGVVQDSPVDLVETFNYLLGLHVKRYDTFGKEHLLFVEGTVKTTTDRDERVLVIWRDCTVWTHEALEPVLAKMLGTRSPDSRIYLEDYDTIYINGDHHLDVTKVGEDARLKVLPIEETFHARMFDTSDVD